VVAAFLRAHPDFAIESAAAAAGRVPWARLTDAAGAIEPGRTATARTASSRCDCGAPLPETKYNVGMTTAVAEVEPLPDDLLAPLSRILTPSGWQAVEGTRRCSCARTPR
jgi:hypothetical protein